MSADERREVVVAAARTEFALGGYDATTTEAIARRVGVSQPYLFRLFPSKKALFLAAMEDCFDSLERLFSESGKGLAGDEALLAMGRAYNALLDDKTLLRLQLQMWAMACRDTDVRDLARTGMARLWRRVEQISGADSARIAEFLGSGMLLNVFAAMDLPRIKQHLGEALTGFART
jgi:AcrR family transcriptional regulator